LFASLEGMGGEGFGGREIEKKIREIFYIF
jgi:hypothetical protein